MIQYLKKWLFSYSHSVFIILVLTTSGCVNTESVEVRASSASFLDRAKELLAGGHYVIVYHNAGNEGSEQFSDWNSYLQAFLTENKNFIALPAPQEVTKLLFGDKYKVGDGYTLFLNPLGDDYFYDGVVVEPQVYMAVHEKYTEGKLSDFGEAFIPSAYICRGYFDVPPNRMCSYVKTKGS